MSKGTDLNQEFILNHRNLYGTPMENFRSYKKTMRGLSSPDRIRFKKMYVSRHGRVPTRQRAILDTRELRELEALSKQAALENFYLVKEAGEDSFFDKIRAGWHASQHYSPKELKQLKTRGNIVRPKGGMNKVSRDEAYYNYLMVKEGKFAPNG